MFSVCFLVFTRARARVRVPRVPRASRPRAAARAGRAPPAPGAAARLRRRAAPLGPASRVAACRSVGGVPPGVPRPRFGHAGPPSLGASPRDQSRSGFTLTHALRYSCPRPAARPSCAARARENRRLRSSAAPAVPSRPRPGPELPSIVVPPRRTTAARHVTGRGGTQAAGRA
jgi:hypothetical protein